MISAPVYPARPRPGDAVAVLSPAVGLPGILPLPFELGLRRLREDFGLRVVEYPTTRKMGSSPQERADDLHAVPQLVIPYGGTVRVDGPARRITVQY